MPKKRFPPKTHLLLTILVGLAAVAGYQGYTRYHDAQRYAVARAEQAARSAELLRRLDPATATNVSDLRKRLFNLYAYRPSPPALPGDEP